MQRSLLILSASVLLVACEGSKSPWSSSSRASSGVSEVNGQPVEAAAPGVKFSWDKDTPAEAPKAAVAAVVEAPKDPNKARVLEVREAAGLIFLLRSDKPDVKARLQLVKDGKAIEVEVVKVSDKNEVVANIIPNQEKTPKLAAGDEVACGVRASAPQ
ncbi:MAG: hypothetical protein EBR62_08145 [Verrucomicrobia bacterium]|jgi:hypothetical protein|nr:hypothetical protein [Verrucomicrobiota bacterium]